MGFPIDDRKMKRAGLDYWDKLDITYYESLEDFMEQMDGHLYLISKFAEKVYSEENFAAEGSHYFMFGVRTRGCQRNLCVVIQKRPCVFL